MNNSAVIDNSSCTDTPSVLLVDDSELVRSVLTKLLGARGYRVIEAANGREGLEMFASTRPDLVITDLQMPEMDGLTFIAELNDRYINIPVIVISGEGTLPQAIEAVRLGAWDYVIKPIRDVRELEITITRALERARLIEDNHRYRQHLEELVQSQTREIREGRERLSQLFLQHEDAIFLFKLDSFEIIDSNPAATELYGFSSDELLGAFPWPFAGERHEELRDTLLAALDQNGRFDVFRITLVRKDGTPARVSMRGKLVTIADERVVYCSTRDISEKIRLEEDVRDTQSKLIQANKMASLGMLSSGIAHEINNPNNFIMFNSALLAETWQAVEEILDEYAVEHGDFPIAGLPFSEVRAETPRLIEGLTEGARRIQAIVETLKGFVRQDADFAVMCIDINKTIRMAMTLLSHEIRHHGHEITLDLAGNLPHIAGNCQQIEQVIINLVTNALHAVAENDGKIRLATTYDSDGEAVLITVQDDGVGMTVEELERVAEPFFTTRSAQGGTGLGVSISLSIVREHNGTLVYTSATGHGTTATVRLPASSCVIPLTASCGGLA